MSIERINLPAPEDLAEEVDSEADSKFPPFDPENAERIAKEAKAGKRNTFSIDVEAAYKILSEDQKDNLEYDFRNADRYQEQTFMLAAANSLVNSPDIMHIDRVASIANERATEGSPTIFEALKTLSQETGTGEEGEFAATDLMNAFVDTTAAYVVSKDEKPARGLAKGLITTMKMRLASAPTNRPNRAADELKVDLELVQPIINEFIEGYNTEYESPNDFKDYLKNALEIEEADLRSARNRNTQPAPDTERRIQALKSTLTKLDELQSNYKKNLQILHDTAYANHRIIK